jgi:hypothetical protein
MYVCPFCNREFETLKDLKIHFKRHDASYCPFCKTRYKNPSEHYIKYYQKTKDERHLILYYLSTNLYKNHKPNSKLFKKASDITKELVLKDEEDRN